MMMAFALLDITTMSGWREVAATSCGKTHFTLNFQSEATCRMLGRVLVAVPVLWVFTPWLTKVIPFDGWPCVLLLALTHSCSTHFTISARTLSCLHLNRPSANAFVQPIRIRLSVHAVAPHSLHEGSSSKPQVPPREASQMAFTWHSSSSVSWTLCITRPLLALVSALLHLFPL